jgi:hypothetical protein
MTAVDMTWSPGVSAVLASPQESIRLMQSPSPSRVGHDWIPDHEYSLAYLCKHEGNVFGMLYDFGDRIRHHVTVRRLPVFTIYARSENDV